MSELWDYPSARPQTPPLHATEGYPLCPDTSPTLRRKPNGELWGLTYSESVTAVIGARWDDKIRILYNLLCRLAYHGVLACGPNYPCSLAADTGGPNWTDGGNYDATGSGTSITLTWDNETETGPQFNPIYPGMFATDGTQWAIVLDLAFTSQESMTLTLSRALDAGRTGQITIVREGKVPQLPALTLQHPTRGAQCAHCQPCYGSLFTSFKQYFGASWVSGSWYCDQFKTPGAALSSFTAGCNNTACPLYSAFKHYKPKPGDLSLILGGRNIYIRTPVAGGGNPTIGRETLQGILHTLGMPGTRMNADDAAWVEKISYAGWAALVYPTGATVNGFDEYLTYPGLLAKRRAASIEEEDNIGLFAQFPSLSKKDPSGGVSPTNRVLRTDAPGRDFEAKTAVRRLGTWGPDAPASFGGNGVRHVQRARPRVYYSPAFSLGVDTESTTETYFNSNDGSGKVVWRLPQFGDRKANPITVKTKSIAGSLAAYSISGDVATLEFALGEITVTHGTNNPPSETTFDCGGNVVSPQQTREVDNFASGAQFGSRQEKITPGDVIQFTGSGKVHVIGSVAFGGSVQAGARNPPTIGGVPLYVINNHDRRDVVYVSLQGASGAAFRLWLSGGGGDVWQNGAAYSVDDIVTDGLGNYFICLVSNAFAIRSFTLGDTYASNETVWDANSDTYYYNTDASERTAQAGTVGEDILLGGLWEATSLSAALLRSELWGNSAPPSGVTLPVALTSVELSASAPPTLLPNGEPTGYVPAVEYTIGDDEWNAVQVDSWDPVTGEILIVRENLPSDPAHLRATLWVNCLKVRHSCEDVTWIEDVIDGLENGWWPVGGSGTTYFRPIFWYGNTWFDWWTLTFARGLTAPWSITDPWGENMGTDVGTVLETTMAWGVTGSPRAGFALGFWGSGFWEADGWMAIPILHVNIPAFWDAPHIQQAMADISFSAPVHTIYTETFNAIPSPHTDGSTTVDTNFDDIRLFGCWFRVVDGLLEFVLGDPVELSGLVEVTISGVVYRRGTIDITDLMIAAATPPSGDGWSFGWMPSVPDYTPASPLTPESLGEMFYAGGNAWSGSVDENNILTSASATRHRWVSDGVSISNIKLLLVDGVTKSLYRYQPTSSGMYGGARLAE